ncbi:MAG: alpha/beta fold hydrolase [Bradymonadia bacterium]
MRPAHRSRITAQISGLSYACNVWDGGGQTTVILLHGFLDCGLNWQFLVDALGDSDWHIVAPDWRGHGDTEWIGRGGYYHFTDYARDLEQIAQRFARNRTVVVGHSMGAMALAHWLGSRPENVDGAVLVEAVGPLPLTADDYPIRLRRWLEQTNQCGDAQKNKSMPHESAVIERLRTHHPRLDDARIKQMSANLSRQDDFGAFHWKFDPLHRTTSPMPSFPAITEAYLAHIQCPLLWVGGAESPFLRPELDNWLDHAQNLEKVVLSGVGHMVHTEDPESLACELTRFEANLEAGSRPKGV